MIIENKIELLKKIPLFQNLTEQQLSQVLLKLKEETFDAGQTIINEGDNTTDLYVITKGSVNIEKWDEQKKQSLSQGKLKSGDTFGELSFKQAKPRSASVIAITHVEVLKLSRSSLSNSEDKELIDLIFNNISEIVALRTQKLDKFLADASLSSFIALDQLDSLLDKPIFKGMNKSELVKIYTYMEPEEFLPNETILNEGEKSTDLYFILEGSVNVLKWDHNHINQEVIATLKKGESFGEISFVGESEFSARTTTIKTIRHTTVLKLSRNSLSNPSLEELKNLLFFNITSINAKRLQDLNATYANKLNRTEKTLQNGRRVEMLLISGYLLLFLFALLSSLSQSLLQNFLPWIFLFFSSLFILDKFNLKWTRLGFQFHNWQTTLLSSLIFISISLGLIYLLPYFLKNQENNFSAASLWLFGALAIFVEIGARGMFQSLLHEVIKDKDGYKTIVLNALFLAVALTPLGYAFAVTFFLFSLPMGYLFFQQKSLLGVCLIHAFLCLAGIINF